ncbi:MAG: hypothetical protein CMO81_02595 [Waddliaceae bacterium]|nr:hypothetical protein [Waddliaceae bacterium]
MDLSIQENHLSVPQYNGLHNSRENLEAIPRGEIRKILAKTALLNDSESEQLARDCGIDQLNSSSIHDLFLVHPVGVVAALRSERFRPLLMKNMDYLIPSTGLSFPGQVDLFAFVTPVLEKVYSIDELAKILPLLSPPVFTRLCLYLPSEKREELSGILLQKVSENLGEITINSPYPKTFEEIQTCLLEEKELFPGIGLKHSWALCFRQVYEKREYILGLSGILDELLPIEDEKHRVRILLKEQAVKCALYLNELQEMTHLEALQSLSYDEISAFKCLSNRHSTYSEKDLMDCGLKRGADLRCIGFNPQIMQKLESLEDLSKSTELNPLHCMNLEKFLLREKEGLDFLISVTGKIQGLSISEQIKSFTEKLKKSWVPHAEDLQHIRQIMEELESFRLNSYMNQNKLKELWGKASELGGAGPLRKTLRKSLPEGLEEELDCLEGIRYITGDSSNQINYFLLEYF